ASDGGGAAQAIGIPMYVDPSSSAATWAQVTAAAPTVALLVANPASGPGGSAQAEYTQAIATAHAAGQAIIGYVHTSYGNRALAQVEADADAWYSFYPAIDGIFVDEGSTDTSTIAPYYQPLHDHVKAEPAGSRTVALNPGTLVDESFLQAADVIVTFEDTYANYTNGSYPPNPAWMATYPRWRFWHLVLSAATTSDMQNAVMIARQRNAGYVYVTDQGPATAYQQLVTGAYWQAELAAAGAP
ncbi:MAG TPA: spherulation-specific family 4 protein, partial [Polyangiaceae bacterium]